ncbi:MAG: tRNA (guanosine(46)-N7)-methyltransferase TrmB [Chitinophagaceae bacterium]
MGQKKLLRFEAIKAFPNVLQYPEDMSGNWKDFFKNHNDISLELACGKGEYAVQLALIHTKRNFIGVDLKGNRLYIGAKKCLERNINNAAFLRTQIDKIHTYFVKNEVKEIWITFPDPQLRNSKAKKRLTHPRFLRLYQQFLIPNGNIHLKTDSPDLYDFTKMVIEMYGLTLHEDYEDLYANTNIHNELLIKTYYETLDIAKSNKIHYLRFSLPSSGLPDLDHLLQERIYNHEKIN